MDDRYLYRGKRTDNGEWVEGNLVNSVYKNNDTCVGTYGSNVGMHQVDPSTICQCTGLKDKNGTWTSVDEMLPSESSVICTDIHGKMMIGYLDYDESSSTKQICISENDEVMYDVVAWMSLPKPYEKATTDEN